MDWTIIFQLQQSRKKLKFQIKVHFLFPFHFTTSYACLMNRVLTIAVCTVMHAVSLLNLNQAPTSLQRNHCTNLINFDTSFFFITNMMQNSKLTINLLDHQVILAVRISQINENAISNSLCKHNTMHVASQRGKKEASRGH